MYTIENYQGSVRYKSLYNEISDFLRTVADAGYNEHFHWGRLEWMMAHPLLDVDMLFKNAVFRDAKGSIVGAVLFDTSFDDRWYLLHSTEDEALLRCMIGYVRNLDAGFATMKANLRDSSLCTLLTCMGWKIEYSEKYCKRTCPGMYPTVCRTAFVSAHPMRRYKTNSGGWSYIVGLIMRANRQKQAKKV